MTRYTIQKAPGRGWWVLRWELLENDAASYGTAFCRGIPPDHPRAHAECPCSACPGDGAGLTEEMTMTTVYGSDVQRTGSTPRRSLMTLDPQTTATGNIVLRVGREHENSDCWAQTEHVVLTPPEARGLARKILELVDDEPVSAPRPHGNVQLDDLIPDGKPKI